MKKNTNVIVQKINGEYMIVPTMDGAVQMEKVYCVSDTGAFIWDCIPEECEIDIEQLIELVAKKYGISKDEIKEDIISFIDDLKKHNLVIDY